MRPCPSSRQIPELCGEQGGRAMILMSPSHTAHIVYCTLSLGAPIDAEEGPSVLSYQAGGLWLRRVALV